MEPRAPPNVPSAAAQRSLDRVFRSDDVDDGGEDGGGARMPGDEGGGAEDEEEEDGGEDEGEDEGEGGGAAVDDGDEADDDDEEEEEDEAPFHPLTDLALSMLRLGDASLTSLHVAFRREIDEPPVVPRTSIWSVPATADALARCARLTRIQVEATDTSYEADGYALAGDRLDEFRSFCRGLGRNRSVEELRVRMWNCSEEATSTFVEDLLVPMLEGNRALKRLSCDGCQFQGRRAPLLVGALRDRVARYGLPSLRRLELINGQLDPDDAAALVTVLDERHRDLACLDLGGNPLGAEACAALASWLRRKSLPPQPRSPPRKSSFSPPPCPLRALRLDCTDVDDERVAILAEAVKSNRTLRKLSLSQNEDLKDAGVRSLSEALEAGTCGLRELGLAETTMGDAGAQRLGRALSCDRCGLKSLNLFYSDDVGAGTWCEFDFGKLEEVLLGENDVDDDVCAALRDASEGSLRNLKKLRLDDNQDVTEAGWRDVATLLQRRKVGLKEVDFNMNDVGGAGSAIAAALDGSATLEVLELGSTRIDPDGWRALAAALPSMTALRKLKVGSNPIDDALLASLARAIGATGSVKRLDVHCLDDVTPEGWRAALPLLVARGSGVEALNASINGVSDAAAMALVDAMREHGNVALRVVDFDACRSLGPEAWGAFARLVCDRSSPAATYASNRTLRKLIGKSREYPEDLALSLELNGMCGGNDAARRKMLRCHVEELGRPEAIGRVPLGALPLAAAWAGKDQTEASLSLLYRIVRTMSSLVENGSNGTGLRN